MKQILIGAFATLGVLFLLVLAGLAYVFFADPFGLFSPAYNAGGSAEMQADGTGGNAALSEQQQRALESFGIDPASIPSEITPEQEQCATEILGEARVNEIKNGAAPTAVEFYSTRECF